MTATVSPLRPNTAPAEPTLHRHGFRALGTQCSLQFHCREDDHARGFIADTEAWVRRFESRYTRFRPDSLVGRLNAGAGDGRWHPADEEFERMLDICATLHALSDGILDATAGPLIAAWDYHRQPAQLPDAATLQRARQLTGWRRVERLPGGVRLPERGMSLDFGGWGKEFAVDAAAQIARGHGITAALIDFGRDIYALGHPPGRPAWHVGLEDPAHPDAAAGCIAVAGRGVAGSGDYRRGFVVDGRHYGHIIDPRTGWPVHNGCRQVVIVAPSCLQAGVLATTAFILGAELGLQRINETMGVEGRIVTTAGTYSSRGYYQHELR